MVCTGAKSEKEAKLAVKRVVEKLSGHGITVKNEPVVEIQNIVAYANLYEEVDLERLVYKLRKTILRAGTVSGHGLQNGYPKGCFPHILKRKTSVLEQKGKKYMKLW